MQAAPDTRVARKRAEAETEGGHTATGLAGPLSPKEFGKNQDGRPLAQIQEGNPHIRSQTSPALPVLSLASKNLPSSAT